MDAMDTYEMLDFYEALSSVNWLPFLGLIGIVIIILALIPVIVNMIYTYTVMKRLKEIAAETKQIAMILERQNARPRPNPGVAAQQAAQNAAPAQPTVPSAKTPTAPQS